MRTYSKPRWAKPQDSMPIRSIAIIPDGTRRWSRREGVCLKEGYRRAFELLLAHVDALRDRGVEDIHIYMFSLFNLKRAEEEVVVCLDVEAEFLESLVRARYEVRLVGDLAIVDKQHPGIARAVLRAATATPGRSRGRVHAYLGYSFDQHLSAIAADCSCVEELVRSLVSRRVDLVVRTGGALTLSDFLPIDLRYAQLHFLPDFFNDYSVEQLMTLCDSHEIAARGLKYGS